MRLLVFFLLCSCIQSCSSLPPDLFQDTCYAVIVTVKVGEDQKIEHQPAVICSPVPKIIDAVVEKFGDSIVAIDEMSRCEKDDCATAIRDLLDSLKK